MPASQLKRLKASLRDQGIVGPQQSKKQKKKNAQDERGRNDRRLQRGAALENIREQFNPFQFKTNARGPKFEVTTNKPEKKKGILGRPGMAKALGEERRKETLLVEMQRRNRTGGIFDRRFGEGDPNMTPETAAAHRFAMEKQRAHKKTSMFDLEEDDDLSQGISLTHAGKSLTFGDDGELLDDFDEEFSEDGSDMSDLEEHNRKRLKRLRDQVALHEGGDQEEPERKKTKKEVMEEVIAKSKLHKYERQAAKEDDEDLRLELDKETADIRRLLLGQNRKDVERTRNGEKQDDLKAIAIPGVDKDAFEKDYDLAVKKMVADKRAKPTMRTKTEEQVAEEQSNRLRELEEKRLKRMRGEEVRDSEEEEDDDDSDNNKANKRPAVEIIRDNGGSSEDFGLGKGIKMRPTATELGFDDEDDFIIDDDLVASGSDIEDVDDDDAFDESDVEGAEEFEDDEDDEFTKGLLTESESKDAVFSEAKHGQDGGRAEDGLPYTFPCPQTHPEFLAVIQDIPLSKVPTVIQRIRALYHPKLLSTNKEKLGNFSRVLVQHIAHMQDVSGEDLYAVLELLIRHVHSLAKMFPIEIAKEFRSYLEEMENDRPLHPSLGDLYILTAIGSIFPTSDHFHQVVTPAMLSMGRFLGQKIPGSLADYATGTYLSTLAVQYQKLAKRYVPEVMNFTLNTICALAPAQARAQLGAFPVHEPAAAIRTTNAKGVSVRKLKSYDCSAAKEDDSSETAKSLKVALLSANISLLQAASETWTGKASFHETFEPAAKTLKHLTSKVNRTHLPDALLQEAERTATHLSRAMKVATLSRRPLELHNHRPLAIKTYIPKFEDDFDPDKHYDPDRERAELAKLKAEHKKERKGAMRELRKDANFLAREKLRLKKEKDAAYEKKYKRLVAEIQGEEGHQANLYDKEKSARKRAKNR
ncbi:Nop14-like protein [Cryphonectria parasitica EP155]|uniref:Nop14-like protein n=1 Tax=Cryphonectria parasitica (strain ATCC 38755 / EP155) TaxID=660469 RepID=A0A9P5CM18_CRYP1|nr:Nop14-like protein [Cryphonectria parasitica EP155]KAF3762410.1 Nop14-like protein [Cryphonectria parasitica EP155]